MSDTDRSIAGVARTVSELLEKKKYSIDYYQREYKWEAKQIAELVADLSTRFLHIHEIDHARKDVAKYPGYYLGSIIISQKGGQSYIVDGQQRLTSLTLLLTYLRRLQIDHPDTVDIDQLIFSEKYGEKSFNLDIPDRNECMEALFEKGEYELPDDASESVRTLVDRYSELDDLLPKEIKETALPFFIDWLKERVQFVQITAYTDDDAYTIFETMNDRGLKLTPSDMLKGYLLANMEDGTSRNEANQKWRERLQALGERAEDAGPDFLKTWLRSQYSTKIRERRKGARPEDWDRIGTEFHRWLREMHKDIGLKSRENFHHFVMRDLDFYSRQYERVLDASDGGFDPTSPLRFIRYNADLGFTLQDQLLLAPLRVDDTQKVIDQKFEMVGRFTDILLAWRIWNFRATDYSTLQYAMFIVMRKIRGLDVDELAGFLHEYLHDTQETFDSNDELRIHKQNRRQIHRILARITDFVTTGSNRASNYVELTNGSTVRYEVEHIWSNNHERHTEEFPHADDFERYRNRIGGLLLLPKKFNASYNAARYEEKLPHYLKHNLLAASLNSSNYEKDPGFISFIDSTGFPFKSHDEFKKADLAKRGELYREIAKKVWNPDDLLTIAKRDT